jgi:hypothetical protein
VERSWCTYVGHPVLRGKNLSWPFRKQVHRDLNKILAHFQYFYLKMNRFQGYLHSK